MSKYCYWCGTQVNGKYCKKCGIDTDPPADVYFLDEECGDCDTRLPRWAHYCPKCGRKFGVYDPGDSQNKKRHNRGQMIGIMFWSIVIMIIVTVIPIASDDMTIFKYTLPVGAFLVGVLWIIVLSRWERGKFIDGTVTMLYTENKIHKERSVYKKTITGRPVYHDVPITVYCTAISWDNGKEETIKRDCIAADHIQLKVGDRLRFLKAKRKYQKL